MPHYKQNTDTFYTASMPATKRDRQQILITAASIIESLKSQHVTVNEYNITNVTGWCCNTENQKPSQVTGQTNIQGRGKRPRMLAIS